MIGQTTCFITSDANTKLMIGQTKCFIAGDANTGTSLRLTHHLLRHKLVPQYDNAGVAIMEPITSAVDLNLKDLPIVIVVGSCTTRPGGMGSASAKLTMQTAAAAAKISDSINMPIVSYAVDFAQASYSIRTDNTYGLTSRPPSRRSR